MPPVNNFKIINIGLRWWVVVGSKRDEGKGGFDSSIKSGLSISFKTGVLINQKDDTSNIIVLQWIYTYLYKPSTILTEVIR